MSSEEIVEDTVDAIESLVTTVNSVGGDIPLRTLMSMSMRHFLTNVAIPNRIRFTVKSSDKGEQG